MRLYGHRSHTGTKKASNYLILTKKQFFMKSRSTAEIRTTSVLLPYSEVKHKKHKCSMIENPSAWLFIKVKNIFYPYIIA